MHWPARLHFLHRAWRYRLRTEKFAMSFLLARDLRGKTALDIGANQGIYSYWMSRCVGPEGRVIAFEPQPELAAHLRDLRDSFRLRNLEIAEAGLSSRDAELTLRRPKAQWGGASLESYADDARAFDFIPVKVTTIDGYFANHPARPIAFIKCDAENHEHHVFRGGHRILTEDRPDLLFECHGASDPRCEAFAELRTLGYEGYCFFGGGLAPVADYASLRPRMHPKALVDFVFLPAERATVR
jgi:FkbM family methyltransferase